MPWQNINSLTNKKAVL